MTTILEGGQRKLFESAHYASQMLTDWTSSSVREKIAGRDNLEISQPCFPPPNTPGNSLILGELSPTRKLCPRLVVPLLTPALTCPYRQLNGH